MLLPVACVIVAPGCSKMFQDAPDAGPGQPLQAAALEKRFSDGSWSWSGGQYGYLRCSKTVRPGLRPQLAGEGQRPATCRGQGKLLIAHAVVQVKT